MTHAEAEKTVAKFIDDTTVDARIVRILPHHIDPPTDGDNGWDVEFTVK